MASQEYMDKMELRKDYANLWHTDLMSTTQADLPYCCFAFWRPCVSYLLRNWAMYDDMSRYVCCAGYMPCSRRCGESKCPEFCLCMEGFMFCLQQVACIFSIVAVIVGSDEIQAASHLLNCVRLCILHTQHKVEMDKRDGKFGLPGPMAPPSVQQMSRIDQPVPPLVGYPAPYPAQSAYGQPYSCPPPQGYPPAAYPFPQGQYPK